MSSWCLPPPPFSAISISFSCRSTIDARRVIATVLTVQCHDDQMAVESSLVAAFGHAISGMFVRLTRSKMSGSKMSCETRSIRIICQQSLAGHM